MQLKIATWNINSLRLRQDQVCKVLKQEAPHIICLQEIKSPVEFVPKDPFESIGYKHIVARGEKGYNGVAVISRLDSVSPSPPSNFLYKFSETLSV